MVRHGYGDDKSTVGSVVSEVTGEQRSSVVQQYYDSIQASTRTPSKSNNRIFETPHDLSGLIAETDNLTDKSPNRAFRKQFKIFSVLLHTFLRKSSQEKRVVSTKPDETIDGGDRRATGKRPYDGSDDETAVPLQTRAKRERRSSSCSNDSLGEIVTSKMSKNEAIIYEKVKTRQSVLPEEMYRCKSVAAMLSTALFCLHDYRKEITVKAIIDIYKNVTQKYANVSDVVSLVSKSVCSIAEILRPVDINQYKNLDLEFRKSISMSLMDLAEILNERNLSHTLMTLDYDLYIDTATAAVKRNVYKTTPPFQALISEYIKKCIALCERKKKTKEILEQFDVNPLDTIMLILSNLRAMREADLKSTTAVTDTRKVYFDPETVYYVFRGTPHFESHVSVTCKTINDDVYQIKSYKNCVFDVIGTQKQGLFHDKTWLERLNTINITPKVVVEEILGKELNNVSENVYLGVSWMENKCSMYRTFNIVKSKKK